jgi:hypothetical protein
MLSGLTIVIDSFDSHLGPFVSFDSHESTHPDQLAVDHKQLFLMQLHSEAECSVLDSSRSVLDMPQFMLKANYSHRSWFRHLKSPSASTFFPLRAFEAELDAPDCSLLSLVPSW